MMTTKKPRRAAPGKPAAAKRGPGGPPHEPTAYTRKLVSALAFEGATQARIALHLEVDEKTLAKYYRKELDLGTEYTCALVAQSMAKIATRPNGGMAAVAAGRYILGCRGGWRDVSRVEVEQVGRGITAVIEIARDAERYAMEDLLAQAEDAANQQPQVH